MFHPRPFGGIVNIFSKSGKGEQGSKAEGNPVGGGDAPAAQVDPTAITNEGFLSNRRTQGEDGIQVGPKAPDGKAIADDFKSFNIGNSNHAVKKDPDPEEPTLVIPENAAEMAAQGVFDKLHLLQIMFGYERLRKEKSSAFDDMDKPKFKFVDSVPHAMHPGVMRDGGHGSREGHGGMFTHSSHSGFDHGDNPRKSLELNTGQRRSYFDHRIQKGRDGFRMGRDSYDSSDYTKRMDHHDVNPTRGDDHGRRKGHDEYAHRGDFRFGNDKHKQNEGPVRQGDDRTSHYKVFEKLKQNESAMHSPLKGQTHFGEKDSAGHNTLQKQQSERFDIRDTYRQLESLQKPLPAVPKPSPEVRITETNIINNGLAIKGADDKFGKYSALTPSSMKPSPAWSRGGDSYAWGKPASGRLETTPVKGPEVFTTPSMKTASGSQSFLERLLDKSFDALEPAMDNAMVETAAHFQKSMQFSNEVSQASQTINMEWQYKDPHGLIHGPFSSKQMYTWYINNFFNPNLQMRYNSKMPWTPFKELYPPNTNPFRENPVGFSDKPGTPSPRRKGESSVEATPLVSIAKEKEPQSRDSGSMELESPVFSTRWNKPEDMKVDSLLGIMEKQKRQSAAAAAAAPKPVTPMARPSPGWNLPVDDPAPVSSDDFPQLSLGVEKSSKGKKKIPTRPFPQPQQSTMSLKAFMKHHAPTPETTKVQPRESFASKVMGNNK